MAIHGATPVEDGRRFQSDDPWIRWTATSEAVYAIVDPERPGWLEIAPIPGEADRASWTAPEGLQSRSTDRGVAVKPPRPSDEATPVVIRFARSDRTR